MGKKSNKNQEQVVDLTLAVRTVPVFAILTLLSAFLAISLLLSSRTY